MLPDALIASRLRAVPDGTDIDAAIRAPAYRAITVAMRPIAVPVIVFSAMFESLLIVMSIMMFPAVAFALVTNLYEIG